MDNTVKRYYIKNNVLVVSEVMQLLNVSRQMVREYVKKGVLIPAKETPNGMLFLKDDVLEYSKKGYYNQVERSMFKKKEIIGEGVTWRGVAYFENNVSEYENINSVRIYFHEYDALLDNYFTLEDDYAENQLIRVKSPLFVIGFTNGEEIWLDSCNCGYGGEGPHGSEAIMRKIGIDQEKINELFYCKKISYFKENDEWLVEKPEEKTQKIEEKLLREMSDASGTVYLFNGHLVLLENSKYNVYRDDKTHQFIEKYIDFIPQPVSIMVLSKEEAMQTGHCNWNFGNPIYYQVILKDRSGRELWFQRYIDENVPINNQKSIQEILSEVGFDFKNGKKNWTEYIKEWINYKPRLEKMVTINLEEEKIN